MSDLISVIIPIYNTGKLLQNCISSVLNQDYPNLEILLVDDGSTDDLTLTLCDQLAANHSNVLLYHKSNGGSASARNYGIKQARGKYIGFVDSDDVIDSTMYSALYSAIVKDKAKVSICSISTESDGKVELNDEGLASACYNNHDLLHHFFLGHWHSTCTCLYDKSLFENIWFPEGEVNEDYMLNYFIFKDLDKLSFVNKPLYHYLRRAGSNTSSPKSLRFLDWIKHTKQILGEMSHDSSLRQESEYQYLYSNIILANSSLLTLSRIESNEAAELYKIVTDNLSKDRNMLKRNTFLKGRNRYLSFLMAYTPRLYKNGVLTMLKLKRMI